MSEELDELHISAKEFIERFGYEKAAEFVNSNISSSIIHDSNANKNVKVICDWKDLTKQIEIGNLKMIEFDEMTDEQRQPYLDHVANMVDGLLYCNRVWSAWSYGTMGPNDFSEMDDEWIYEKAKEMYEFFMEKNK